MRTAKTLIRPDWVDAQADLSLRWVHRSFCWFCCEVAHLNDPWQKQVHVDGNDAMLVACIIRETSPSKNDLVIPVLWYMSCCMKKQQQNDLCTQRRLRSAWASAQFDQSSLSARRNLGSIATHWVHSEDWPDWGDAQADLSVCWVHMSFRWFCLAAAHMDSAKRIWYLSPMRAAKVQASLRIRAVSPEPPLLAHTSSESRGPFRQKARSLALLNG